MSTHPQLKALSLDKNLHNCSLQESLKSRWLLRDCRKDEPRLFLQPAAALAVIFLQPKLPAECCRPACSPTVYTNMQDWSVKFIFLPEKKAFFFFFCQCYPSFKSVNGKEKREINFRIMKQKNNNNNSSKTKTYPLECYKSMQGLCPYAGFDF